MLRPLENRTCLVTGANTGIGRVTAVELGRLGAHVIVATRTREKGAPVVEQIVRAGGTGDVVEIDLGSLASVRAAAAAVLAKGVPIHLLVNNAGLAGHRGLTVDGFEIHFGVNHIGHFVLTDLLLERVRAAAPSRIVTVASAAHARARGIDFDAMRRKTRSLSGWSEYSVSKLANVLFSAELARRLEGTGVSTYAVHPGVVGTDLWRRVPWPIRPLIQRRLLTNAEGARTTLHCCTSPDAQAQTGLYWDECAPRRPSRTARDPDLARTLWERSVSWTAR